jgi:Ca2+-binding EF-hand superfamily protein
MSPPTLLYFDATLDQALELELTFASHLRDEVEAYKKPPVSFLATPEGIAIQTQEPRFLFWLPKADLQAALANARGKQNARERIDAPALQRFDKNNDGWLDDAETRAMRQDKSWQIELASRMENARAAAIKEHGVEYENMFKTADKNGDGKLNTFEFASLVKAPNALMAERLIGCNTDPWTLTRPYDLNSDATLDRAEFTRFMSDPRLPSAMNRSVDWVTNFGLTISQCDTNGDGVLDSAERAAALRLIRRGAAQRALRQN